MKRKMEEKAAKYTDPYSGLIADDVPGCKQAVLWADKHLKKITSEECIYRRMRFVPQNATTETLDFTDVEKNREAFSSMFSEPSEPTTDRGVFIRNLIRPIRMRLMEFFTGMFLRGLGDIPTVWWFENGTRLDKLLWISLTLESINLSTLDGNPTPTSEDIPQPLVATACALKLMRKKFPEMKKQHKELCESFIPEYASVYTRKGYE